MLIVPLLNQVNVLMDHLPWSEVRNGLKTLILNKNPKAHYGHGFKIQVREQKKVDQVLPRFELGSLDSKSRVLTITP